MAPLKFCIALLLLVPLSLGAEIASIRVLGCPETCTDTFPLEELMCAITTQTRDPQAFCDTVITGARYTVLSRINICQWTERHVAASGGGRCMGGGGLPP